MLTLMDRRDDAYLWYVFTLRVILATTSSKRRTIYIPFVAFLRMAINPCRKYDALCGVTRARKGDGKIIATATFPF
jgi:hypothetical protein